MINIASSLTKKFKNNPSMDYSLGISATWAGAGSLIVGINMVQLFGLIPFLLWATGNILACIVFGLVANRYEYLRKVFTSNTVKLIIGFMCIFQVWVNMSGVHDSLTIVSENLAVALTFVVGIAFIILFLKFAMIRNVLTDSNGWKLVYVLIIGIAVVGLITQGVNVPELGTGKAEVMDGLNKLIVLIPGPFFFPCFWALFGYNNDNKEGVNKINMERCFIKGGLFFGLYLAFVFVLGVVNFTHEMNIVKGILIALVALSSLTSFIFSIYLTFGNKIGLVVNIFALVGWWFLIPMGVMNIWSLMANCRLYIVIALIVVAIAWKLYDDKNKQELKQ